MTDCIEFSGCKDPQTGYGKRTVARKHDGAHRFAWIEHHGRSIPPGLVVMHICDNPPCINPDHLRLGTYSDNTRDMYAKGRMPPRDMARGERVNTAKLTADQVRDIRQEWTGEYGQLAELARSYGVRPYTIRLIVERRTWRHVA